MRSALAARGGTKPVQVSEALPDGGMRSRALEDLAPLLDRAELASNLVADEEDHMLTPEGRDLPALATESAQ